jgi:CDGSH-type Zn-finger protein
MGKWQNQPYAIDVKAGETKAFCACGLSKNGPYCDGSHAGSEKRPYFITFDTDKTIHACGCQASANRPYCDGSHSKVT